VIVYLLRHGIAEDPAAGGADAERALTDEGVRRLERASKAWRRIVVEVDRIFVSPLVRAKQTAAIFAHAAGKRAQIAESGDLVPGARPAAAQELLLRELQGGAEAVACVGHEPHLGGLLGLLLTGSDRIAIPLKKGMLVGVELDSSASTSGRLLFALNQRLAGEL
jgi:phosphohistidine phosphatase